MDRCAFCYSLVGDGDYLKLKGSKYRLGDSCGCSNRTNEELLEIIYYKSFSEKDLVSYKQTFLQLANHPFTDERDKQELLNSIGLMDEVIGMFDLVKA